MLQPVWFQKKSVTWGYPQEAALLILGGFSKFGHRLQSLTSIKQARRTGTNSLPSLRCRISISFLDTKLKSRSLKNKQLPEFTCLYIKAYLSRKYNLHPAQSHGAVEFGSTSSLKSTVTFSEEMSLCVVEMSSNTSKRPLHGGNRDWENRIQNCDHWWKGSRSVSRLMKNICIFQMDLSAVVRKSVWIAFKGTQNKFIWAFSGKSGCSFTRFSDRLRWTRSSTKDLLPAYITSSWSLLRQPDWEGCKAPYTILIFCSGPWYKIYLYRIYVL